MNLKKKEKSNCLNYIVDASKDCKKYVKSSRDENFTKHDYDDSIARSDYCNFLISIIFNTNSIEKTVSILDKFSKKTNHPKEIQFCIKIDNDNEKFVEIFLKKMTVYDFNFVILSSPKGRGYIDLWQWVNYLFKVSSKNSKFIMNISDEMYVDQDHWDDNLKKYINLEKDNIYRLRTSVYKNRNYHDLWECGYAPDTTAIYTRRYLQIQKNFSPCFGPDNGQQIVAYYLSKINYPRHTQFLRDRVINDISFKGQGTNIGLDGKALEKRKSINHLLWLNIFTYKNQTKLFLRARKIQIEILKKEFKSIKILEKYDKYIINFTNKKQDKKVMHLSKKISYFKLFFYNISRYDFFKYNTGYHKNIIISMFLSVYFKIYKKFPKKSIKKNKNSPSENMVELFISTEKKILSILKFENKKLFFLNSHEIFDNLFKKYAGEEKIYGYDSYHYGKVFFNSIFLFINNLFQFIIFYITVIVFLFFQIISLILCFILFWKSYGLIKFIINRFFSFHYCKSYVLRDDNDQSKSFILKGD